jgi:hypothetical protein
MRINTLESGFKGRKLELVTWLTHLLLLQYSFGFASALAVPAKRDNGSDLLNDLVSSFESRKPVASQEGIDLLNQLLNSLQTQPYTIPQKSTDSVLRAANLGIVRTSFLYGSPLAGGPYYPTGPLGIAKSALDFANIQTDLTPELTLTGLDAAKASLDASKVSIYYPNENSMCNRNLTTE